MISECECSRGGDTEHLVVSPPKKTSELLYTTQNQWINIIRQNIDSNKDPLEFTITFKPTIMAMGRQFIKDNLEYNIRRLLYGTKLHPKVILLHEFSKTGLFHYHGIIQGFTSERLSTLREIVARTFGRIELKPIRYWDTYLLYMTKERAIDPKDYHTRKDLEILINIRK